MYVFIIDADVAEDKFGIVVTPPKFYVNDPLGWSLIGVALIGLIYAALKIFIFKKRVRVLK